MSLQPNIATVIGIKAAEQHGKPVQRDNKSKLPIASLLGLGAGGAATGAGLGLLGIKKLVGYHPETYDAIKARFAGVQEADNNVDALSKYLGIGAELTKPVYGTTTPFDLLANMHTRDTTLNRLASGIDRRFFEGKKGIGDDWEEAYNGRPAYLKQHYEGFKKGPYSALQTLIAEDRTNSGDEPSYARRAVANDKKINDLISVQQAKRNVPNIEDLPADEQEDLINTTLKEAPEGEQLAKFYMDRGKVTPLRTASENYSSLADAVAAPGQAVETASSYAPWLLGGGLLTAGLGGYGLYKHLKNKRKKRQQKEKQATPYTYGKQIVTALLD